MILEYNPKTLNNVGIVLWAIIYFLLVPKHIIKHYPLIILGLIYPIFILTMNNFLTGNTDDDTQDKTEFSSGNLNLLNEKSMYISSALFAIAVAIQNIFSKEFGKKILVYITCALFFGPGIILPIYFISDTNDKDKIYQYNKFFMRIRNIALTFSIGFMICVFTLILNKLMVGDGK